MKRINEDWRQQLKTIANHFLELENAAYRIVGEEIVDIVDENEIAAIESAVGQAVSSSSKHLSQALDMLSDRKNPDYRNSIKESISAVEAICQMVANKPNATLPDCLKALKTQKPLHPAFELALAKLYAYTSDEGGIRHALSESGETPSYADAKFMLVVSAAFVNYLRTKAAELGLEVVAT